MAVGPTMRRIYQLIYDSTAKVLKVRLTDATGTDVVGAVTASPTSNTVLDRLKTIATNLTTLVTGIVLAAGTALIGKVGIDQTTPGTTNRIDAQLSGLQVIPFNLFEWTNSTWIATQLLTATGVQLSDEKTIAAGGAETQVFGAIFSPPKAGTLVAVQLGITYQVKSDNALENKTHRVVARLGAGAWVTLMTTTGTITTGYVEKYASGVFYGVANFNAVPFEIALLVTPSATYNISAQVKSSSMGIAIYKPT